MEIDENTRLDKHWKQHMVVRLVQPGRFPLGGDRKSVCFVSQQQNSVYMYLNSQDNNHPPVASLHAEGGDNPTIANAVGQGFVIC